LLRKGTLQPEKRTLTGSVDDGYDGALEKWGGSVCPERWKTYQSAYTVMTESPISSSSGFVEIFTLA
jgi:hypothetical protein